MIENNNTLRVLGWFFNFPTSETYLRELSREMKLSMPAIIAAVNKLQKENLVIVQRKKALTTVKANLDCKMFLNLKRVNNLEKLYTSGLADYLSSSFNKPQAIICFGSYSRGEDIEKSDIDIAIIEGTEKEIPFEKFEKLLKRKISIHHIKLSKISEEFKSNLCNGIILEGAI